jgi:hypothetical protein
MSEPEQFAWTGLCSLEYPAEIGLVWHGVAKALTEQLKDKAPVVSLSLQDQVSLVSVTFDVNAANEDEALLQTWENVTKALGEDILVRVLRAFRNDALDEPLDEFTEHRRKAVWERINLSIFRPVISNTPPVEQSSLATIHQLRPTTEK